MEGSKSKLSRSGDDTVKARVQAALGEAEARRARGDMYGARELALSILALGEEHVEARQLLAAVELASLPRPPRPSPPPPAPPPPVLRPPEVEAKVPVAVAPPRVRVAPAPPRPALRGRTRPRRGRPLLVVGLASGVLVALIAGTVLWSRLRDASAVTPQASAEPPAPVVADSIREAVPSLAPAAVAPAVAVEPPGPQEARTRVVLPDPETSPRDPLRLKETTAGRTPASGASGVVAPVKSFETAAAVAEAEPPGHAKLDPASVAPAPPPPARSAQSDGQEILDVLRRYVAAMEARDLGALKAVWPALAGDHEARVRASFEFARSLRVRLDVQNVQIEDRAAVVSCRRRDVIVTTDGETLSQQGSGTISLVRSDAWRIAAIQ